MRHVSRLVEHLVPIYFVSFKDFIHLHDVVFYSAKVPASHCCSLQLQISQNDTTVVEVPLIFESANSCQNFIQFFLKWRNAVVLGLN
jgi:hypothetical protein